MSHGESAPPGVKRTAAAVPPTEPPFPAHATKTQIELPVSTILKVLVAIGLVLFLGEIWQILFLVFLGFFVALVLARPVSWLEERGLPRSFAIAAVLGVAIGFLVLVLWFVTPGLVTQIQDFWVLLPDYVATTLAWTENRWPDFYQQAVAWAEAQQFDLSSSGFDVKGVLSQGIDVIAGIANIVVVLIIAVYILADQGQSLEGLYHWLPPQRANKIRHTIPR
jgi:predicted PurR-regulated permease PerM